MWITFNIGLEQPLPEPSILRQTFSHTLCLLHDHTFYNNKHFGERGQVWFCHSGTLGMAERLARRSFLLVRCWTTDAFFSGQKMARRPVSLHIHHFGFLAVAMTGKPRLLESSHWKWELNVSGYIIISNTHFDVPISNQLSGQTALNRPIRTAPPHI